MSLFDQIVLKKVCQFYRDLQGPVRTLLIADFLGKHDRYVRGSLVRLEQQGYLARKGRRGGWYPKRIDVQQAEEVSIA